MDLYEIFPILIISDRLVADSDEGRVLKNLISGLQSRGFRVIGSELKEWLYPGKERRRVSADPGIGFIILCWNSSSANEIILQTASKLGMLITALREMRLAAPVFLMTDRLEINNIPVDVLSQINGYIWKTEDTPEFIAGRIEKTVKTYLDSLQPPFFKALAAYTEKFNHAWHTPGHAGGIAFLKSPAGKIFYEFFGKNVLRSDLSVSVPELGSLSDHTGAIKEAEANAARIFGADRTYFVTNGTSTANKIVWQGLVDPGDIVLVDRNCHKSIMHAIILTGAIPVYLMPARNNFGIIGPIHISEFSKKKITEKIKKNPLIKQLTGKIKLTAITNSTYDGICYDIEIIKKRLKTKSKGHEEGFTQNIHFDEAWWAYARFNPLYDKRYATSGEKDKAYNLVVATQSTHKMLAAFSQAAMIHIVDSQGKFSHDVFNEAFMMHSSTSPQYGIIASLDMAAKMMEDSSGTILTQEMIQEANIFRKKMVRIKRELAEYGDKWYFNVWQPDRIKGTDLGQIPDDILNNRAECWILKPGDKWHGFEGIEKGYVMLDPVKVTVLTPGISEGDNGMSEEGIPAVVVTKFLLDRGIVAEKTGFYSFLLLFSMGTTTGKSGNLMAELFEFKKAFDGRRLLSQVFPELSGKYPAGMTLAGLCGSIHRFLKNRGYVELSKSVFADPANLPTPVLIPADAYRQLVAGNVKAVRLSELAEKVSAVMVVPYPPGIPVLMPGEKFNRPLIDYLKLYEDFNKTFPGFENDIHGVNDKDGCSTVYCIDRR